MNGFGLTDKGVRRQENQDYFHLQINEDDPRGIFVVCDGMGGAKAGGVASRLAAMTFIDAINDTPNPTENIDTMGRCLQNAVTASNREVFRTSQTDDGCRGMGTTLVGALVSGETVVIVNVGDSRAYHFSGKKLRQITKDHSVVEDMIARGDITREEALFHPNKHLITKALGTESELTGDLFTLTLPKGDIVLLCSDGLTNVVEEEKILAELQGDYGLEKSCEMLMHLAIAGGAPDNVTVVLFEV